MTKCVKTLSLSLSLYFLLDAERTAVTSTLVVSCTLDQESPAPSYSSTEDIANFDSVLKLYFSNPGDRASFPRFDDCGNVVTERVIYSESFTEFMV